MAAKASRGLQALESASAAKNTTEPPRAVAKPSQGAFAYRSYAALSFTSYWFSA